MAQWIIVEEEKGYLLKGKYAVHKNETALATARKLARGRYQRAIVEGSQALSAHTLNRMSRLKTARASSYYKSRVNLMRRLTEAKVGKEEIGKYGKRLLVIDDFSNQ